jgi:hypothetical protein
MLADGREPIRQASGAAAMLDAYLMQGVPDVAKQAEILRSRHAR